MRYHMYGNGKKVCIQDLRCCVIKDWDSRWAPNSQIPEDFGVQKNSPPRVVGKIREWNDSRNKGMKNIPRKKPHHK